MRTAPSCIPPLSLHDALPILRATAAALRAIKYFKGEPRDTRANAAFVHNCFDSAGGGFADQPGGKPDVSRSEEHTSELQSRFDLVCRLQLEKKTLQALAKTNV